MVQINTKTLRLNADIEIAYIDEGETKNPILFFIHGLANYWQVWGWNINELKNNFRCIALDLPGNGQSSRGDFSYNLSFYSSIIIEFLNALKIKKVNLVGHSMGGQIACKLAIENSKLVDRLILCAPSGFEYYVPHEVVLCKGAMQMGNWLTMDEGHLSQSIRSSFYKASPISKNMIEELTTLIKNNDRVLYRKMVEKSMFAMLDEPIFNHLKQIQQPTLVFFGERDELIPNRFFHHKTTREIAIEACNQLPQARLLTYPETGHFVQIEQAHRVNEEIVGFMQLQ